MFVKPGMRPDDPDRALVVRGPNGGLLSELGGEVPETQFWHRRLRDGDVVPAEPVPMDPEADQVSSDGSAAIGFAADDGSAEAGLDPTAPAMIAEDAP